MAVTVEPDLRNVCTSVAKAFSTWAVDPLKLMVRWLAGMAPMVKPPALSQSVTRLTSELRGANRARHAAAETNRPYVALEGSDTAAARDSAPAASRSPRTAVRCWVPGGRGLADPRGVGGPGRRALERRARRRTGGLGEGWA